MIEEMQMSPRSLTVSTVGIVPGIRRLAAQGRPVNLAISLHAADDELRSRLGPTNRRYPLAELEHAALDYREITGRRVSIEWTMMEASTTARPGVSVTSLVVSALTSTSSPSTPLP